MVKISHFFVQTIVNFVKRERPMKEFMTELTNGLEYGF